MSDRTQDLKNLRAVATACKNYTDKKIEDLKWELGTYDLGVDTVNGTTMLLPTPANTIQSTMVRVDGASEVSENKLVLSDGTETNYGITYVINNGAVSVNGTSTTAFYKSLKTLTLPAGTYYFKSFGATGSSSTYFICLQNTADTSQIVSYSYANGSFTIAETETFAYLLVVRNGATVPSGTQFKDMLVSGSTAPTEFKVGFTGIHNLELSGLKVEGANLCSGYTTPNWRIYINANLKPNTTYYFSCDCTTTVPHAYINNTSNQHLQTLWVSDYSKKITGFSFTTSNDVNGDVILEFAMNAEQNTITWAMLNYGNTAKTYVPYITPTTKTIDLTSIEDSGGNKLFADGKLREDDYITPTEQKSVRNAVDLGSLNGWIYDEGQQRFAIVDAFGDAKFPNENTTVSNITISKDGYTAVSYKSIYTAPYTDMRIAAAIINNHNYFSIRDLRYNTVEAFKTAMSGVMLEYERTTPLVSNTNLSQLVKFEAHSNGSITLVNTNNQDTTSTFKYLKEVAK